MPLNHIKQNTGNNIIIPVIYGILGLVWITLSDRLLFSIISYTNTDRATLEHISQYKGYFYVLLTSVLLYFLIRKHTIRLLAVTEDFRRLFENHPHPMWIYRTDTRQILMANHAACTEYGYTPEEFCQINLYDLRPETEHHKLSAKLQKPAADYSNSGIWLHKRKSGETFYVNIFSHSSIYRNTPCRIVVAQNVNQHVLAEQERINLENALLNSTLLSVTDLSGTIETVNDKFCEVCKYSRGELLGKKHNLLSSGVHPPTYWQQLWETISQGKSWRGEICNRAKDGGIYWVETVINPVFSPEGKIYKYLSINYEISERKQLEQYQAALLKDLSEYAFLTSHELRGPLARILGLTTLFQMGEDAKMIIEKLQEEAKAMDEVIRQMNNALMRNSHELISRERAQRSANVKL